MDKIASITNLLKNLHSHKIEIEDQSASHAGHFTQAENAIFPSHVKMIIISDIFQKLRAIERQRLVYKALAPAFQNGLHAVSLKALTIKEYKDNL